MLEWFKITIVDITTFPYNTLIKGKYFFIPLHALRKCILNRKTNIYTNN